MYQWDRYKLTLSTAPTVEPVTRAEAKLWLRVDSDLTADDSLIDSLILSARQEVESYLFRRLVNSTWTLKFDAFPLGGDRSILIPYPPLSSVSSFTYLATDGTSTALTGSGTDYSVDTNSEPGRVYPAYGTVWPATYAYPLSVTITYVAGYGAAASNVPDAIKTAIKIAVARMYEYREPMVTGTIVAQLPEIAENLLNPYRVWEVA